MVDVAFLETSVFIGFCITADRHHENCTSYVNGETRASGAELASTERVRNEYYRAKNTVIDRLTAELQAHRQRVTRFLRRRDDPLDLPGLESLKTQTLQSGMDTREFMIDFYDQYDYVYHDALTDALRDLIRDIESRPRSRIRALEDAVSYHDCTNTYEDIEDEIRRDSLFDGMEMEDRSICLEAHDLAVVDAVEVEFATANPRDFCYGGRKERLLELTELFNIQNLAA